VFLHGGNAGNIPESTKGAGKGGRNPDGDESEDGREIVVAAVKERRLDDFWRMELKRSASLFFFFVLLNSC
jgi:muskelin